MTMVELTESAKKCLDNYLRRVRVYLKGCKSVDADEIEADIREHIDSEFVGATATVSYDQLDAVLTRLGSPQQWVPEDELPPWRKILLRLHTGPEDWRLAYLTFGLLIVGFIVFPMIIFLAPASFLVARAALSFSDNKLPKGQRWLVYPSLLLIYVPLALAIAFWPISLVVAVGENIEGEYRNSDSLLADDLHAWVITWLIMLSAQGLWWAMLGGFCLKFQAFVKKLVTPFSDRVTTKRIAVVLLTGLVMAVGFALAANFYYRYMPD